MELIVEGNILERIRQCPAMYLGTNSLTAFYHFVAGYSLACGELGAPKLDLLPSDFHDWVAYRLRFLESTSGYSNMILQRTPDEAKALQQFFELLDGYKARCPKVVASVRWHLNEPEIYKLGPGGIDDRRRAKASEVIKLITYTQDPGFFVVIDDTSAEYPQNNQFFPSLAWIDSPYRPDPDFTTIIDAEEFDRLCREDEVFRTEHELRKAKAENGRGKINWR